MDERPRMARALKRMRELQAPVWVDYAHERLRLAPAAEPDDLVPPCILLLATRRGYRVTDVPARRQRYGKGAEVLVDDTGRRVVERCIRARVLERHDLEPSDPR